MPLDTDRLTILIVDDERKACTNLKNLLIEHVDPSLNIAGIANNTLEAEAQIIKLKPDAVFLDIEMPNENAFEFLDRISPFSFEVIFVTAYDEYAVKAFKLNAVDYILKPISIEELGNTVLKLKERIRYKNMIADAGTSYSELSQQASNKLKIGKITLKDINTTEVVDFRDILFIEAQSSYSKIFFIKNKKVKEMTMSYPLSDYEELLPNEIFYRTHRSYLINCLQIKEILNDGSNSVVINNNFTLPISRRRYTLLLDFLKNNHGSNE